MIIKNSIRPQSNASLNERCVAGLFFNVHETLTGLRLFRIRSFEFKTCCCHHLSINISLIVIAIKQFRANADG